MNNVKTDRLSGTASIRSRGKHIACIPGQIRRLDVWRYKVRSQSHTGWYTVTWHKKFWKCEYPFNSTTHQTCKHIYAVLNRNTEFESEPELADCSRCGDSANVVRRGFYKSKLGLIQRYQCKRCHLKFTHRTSFKGMKYTASVITAALDLYFKGLSIRSIADHLNQMHAYQISYPTVYRWIRKYSLKIANYTDGLKPKITSHTWHADEMRLNVNGQPRNLWNLMDHKTRYLLTNQVTKRKGSHEAKHLLAAGLKKSNPTNIDLITDALASYGKAVTDTKTNGVKFRHFEDSGLTKHQSNNRLERLNGSVRQRLKTMRGMDNDQSSKIFTRGFAAYYNFICPHSALGGRTPAQAAGLELNLHHNKWLSLIRKTWERS